MFFECFFVLWFRLLKNTVPTTSAYLPINLRTVKSQSKMLYMQVFTRRNICEKLPKAVSLTSVPITFNIIGGIGTDKASAQNYRTFGQSIHFPWLQAPTKVSTQPPERHNVPPSAPSLTDSNAFGPRFLNSERFEPSEMDPWYFCHMPHTYMVTVIVSPSPYLDPLSYGRTPFTVRRAALVRLPLRKWVVDY